MFRRLRHGLFMTICFMLHRKYWKVDSFASNQTTLEALKTPLSESIDKNMGLACEKCNRKWYPKGNPNLMWLLLMLFLLSSQPLCQAESNQSLSLKTGYIFYDKHEKGPWEGTMIYDNEWLILGAGYRYLDYPNFLRLDYETARTGNVFESGELPNFIPYDGVHIRTHTLVISIGRFINKLFYAGIGGGLGLNDYDLITYPIHPVSLSERPSFVLAGYLGYERPIYHNVSLFGEIWRIWERQRLEIQGLQPGTPLEDQSGRMTEDLSRTEVTAGLRIRF